jgi:hypothetical protein
MERMHELKKRFEKELEQYMHMGDKITMGELETIHKLTDTIKNIDKIMMLEDEEGGYSQAGEMRGGMNRGGNMMPGGYSYRRQRRDSRGRYSRDGGYSYDDGMEELHELLDEMMETADERTKAAIKRFKAELHG